MNWELIRNELKVNHESWMNIHMNELHSSCENGVCDTFIMLLLLPDVHHVLIMCSVHHVVIA